MRTHIQKAYQFLDDHLPATYVEETQEILHKAKIKVSSHVIRNVRNNKRTYNIDVLNALLKVAKKHKKANEALLIETKN